jgi:hypothetical protein
MEARGQGCENPDTCMQTAHSMIQQLSPEFNPLNDINHPQMSIVEISILHPHINAHLGWVLLNKETSTWGDISQNFHVMTKGLCELPALDNKTPICGPNGTAQEQINIYTDGASMKNRPGNPVTAASSGVWFGLGDPCNRAI